MPAHGCLGRLVPAKRADSAELPARAHGAPPRRVRDDVRRRFPRSTRCARASWRSVTRGSRATDSATGQSGLVVAPVPLRSGSRRVACAAAPRLAGSARPGYGQGESWRVLRRRCSMLHPRLGILHLGVVCKRRIAWRAARGRRAGLPPRTATSICATGTLTASARRGPRPHRAGRYNVPDLRKSQFGAL